MTSDPASVALSGMRACVFDAYGTVFDFEVYQLAVDRLDVEPDAISFQSSNAWDANAASAFGMRTAWRNRTGRRPERLPGKPNFEIRSLTDLPALVGA